MKTLTSTTLLPTVILITGLAGAPSASSASERWQEPRLMHSTPAEVTFDQDYPRTGSMKSARMHYPAPAAERDDSKGDAELQDGASEDDDDC